MTRRYRMARPGEHRALMVQDAGVRRLHHQPQHRPLGGPHPGRGAAGPGGGWELAGPVAGPRPAGVLGWPAGAGQPGVRPVGRGRAPRPRGRDRAAPRLDEVHERGAAISTLFPTALQLYRRAGYELAGTWTLYEAAARHLPAGWPEGYRAVPVPADDPAPLQERFARVAAGRSGQVDRDADWWRDFLLADRGSGPPQVFLVDGPARPTPGRSSPSPATSRPATSAPASRWSTGGRPARAAGGRCSPWRPASRRWRRACTGRAPTPSRSPCSWPSRTSASSARTTGWPGWSTWPGRSRPGATRRACGAASPSGSATTCPWVDGTWTIEVDGGEGKAVRVGDDAELRTSAAGLAALFAGYPTPAIWPPSAWSAASTRPASSSRRPCTPAHSPWSPDYY